MPYICEALFRHARRTFRLCSRCYTRHSYDHRPYPYLLLRPFPAGVTCPAFKHGNSPATRTVRATTPPSLRLTYADFPYTWCAFPTCNCLATSIDRTVAPLSLRLTYVDLLRTWCAPYPPLPSPGDSARARQPARESSAAVSKECAPALRFSLRSRPAAVAQSDRGPAGESYYCAYLRVNSSLGSAPPGAGMSSSSVIVP